MNDREIKMREGRRYKCVIVSPIALADFFRKGEFHFKVDPGLPRDSELVGVTFEGVDYDEEFLFFRSLKFIFSHPSWDVVPVGSEIPIAEVVVKDIREK